MFLTVYSEYCASIYAKYLVFVGWEVNILHETIFVLAFFVSFVFPMKNNTDKSLHYDRPLL